MTDPDLKLKGGGGSFVLPAFLPSVMFPFLPKVGKGVSPRSFTANCKPLNLGCSFRRETIEENAVSITPQNLLGHRAPHQVNFVQIDF